MPADSPGDMDGTQLSSAELSIACAYPYFSDRKHTKAKGKRTQSGLAKSARVSQSRTVMSCELDASIDPFGDQATLVTRSVCPSRTCSLAGGGHAGERAASNESAEFKFASGSEAATHVYSRTVLSWEPEARFRLSGDHATHVASAA